MTEDKEAFLDRWSRRKLEHAEEKPALPEKKETEAPAAPLPPIENLTPDSDFTPFMAKGVDGGTRRAALKKLFANAHYNVPDPFEAYSEDWTVGEPIPTEMLKALNHAQKLLFDEPKQVAQPAQPSTPDAPQVETPSPEAKDVAGKQDA